jgi:ADP-L-glycero-D-manno-heptose 6-epimerase
MLLVTGAAGFIGSNVLSALNTAGREDIIAVDDLTNGEKCANLAGRRFADYLDFRELRHTTLEHLPHLDGIIHLGAISDTCCTNGRIVVEQNFTFSKRMLELAERHGCPMLYASSASVYGDGSSGFVENPENERPKSAYAVSKWMFDQYVRRVTTVPARQITVPVTGLRYFNVYGPSESHKNSMASFVYKCLQNIKRNEPIELFEGSNGFHRDFIYISDAIAITMFFLSANMSGIFNVGTGNARSFADVETTCSAIARPEGHPAAIVKTVPVPDFMLAGYQKFTQADITKLIVAGHSAKFVTLEEGVTKYWSYIQESR